MGARPKTKTNLVGTFEALDLNDGSLNLTNGNVDQSMNLPNGNVDESIKNSDSTTETNDFFDSTVISKY